MLHVRQALRTRPRLVLGLLLAFSIEALRPSVHPASHRHPGGDRPHVHAGEVLAGQELAAAGAGSLLRGAGVEQRSASTRAERRPIFRAAPETDLHLHLLRPIHAVRITTLVATAPVLHAMPWAAPAPPGERPNLRLSSRARSPPPLTA